MAWKRRCYSFMFLCALLRMVRCVARDVAVHGDMGFFLGTLRVPRKRRTPCPASGKASRRPGMSIRKRNGKSDGPAKVRHEHGPRRNSPHEHVPLPEDSGWHGARSGRLRGAENPPALLPAWRCYVGALDSTSTPFPSEITISRAPEVALRHSPTHPHSSGSPSWGSRPVRNRLIVRAPRGDPSPTSPLR